LSLFGPKEAGLHALTFISGLLALLAVGLMARRLLSPRRALITSVAFGLAIGLPLFDAELLLPEILLIAPTTWAGFLVLTRVIPMSGGAAGHWTWAALAGGLLGVAVGLQQTALADTAAFALIIALTPGVSRRALLGFGVGFVAVVVSWLAPALVVAGIPAVAFALTVPLALVAGTDFNALQAYAAWPKAQLGQQRTAWSAQLDIRSPADEATAAWIREHRLSQSSAVIWSSSAWLYLLADLPLALPTAPIYNNVVLLGSASAV